MWCLRTLCAVYTRRENILRLADAQTPIHKISSWSNLELAGTSCPYSFHLTPWLFPFKKNAEGSLFWEECLVLWANLGAAPNSSRALSLAAISTRERCSLISAPDAPVRFPGKLKSELSTSEVESVLGGLDGLTRGFSKPRFLSGHLDYNKSLHLVSICRLALENSGTDGKITRLGYLIRILREMQGVRKFEIRRAEGRLLSPCIRDSVYFRFGLLCNLYIMFDRCTLPKWIRSSPSHTCSRWRFKISDHSA